MDGGDFAFGEAGRIGISRRRNLAGQAQTVSSKDAYKELATGKLGHCRGQVKSRYEISYVLRKEQRFRITT